MNIFFSPTDEKSPEGRGSMLYFSVSSRREFLKVCPIGNHFSGMSIGTYFLKIIFSNKVGKPCLKIKRKQVFTV